MRGVSSFRFFGIAALLLGGCMGAPSLEEANQTAAPQQAANSEQYADACHIVETGADRNGQRLPKRAVMAIRAELATRQVDCEAYRSPTIAKGRTAPQSPTESSTPSFSFQQ
jgi:phage-related protein